jgi:hypothetical protein
VCAVLHADRHKVTLIAVEYHMFLCQSVLAQNYLLNAEESLLLHLQHQPARLLLAVKQLDAYGRQGVENGCCSLLRSN